MLNFILENSFFYYTVMVLLLMAFFSTLIVDLKSPKNDFQNFTKLDKIAKTKSLPFLFVKTFMMFIQIKMDCLLMINILDYGRCIYI